MRRLAILALLLSLSACATRDDVVDVVADTNAAMLSPELIQAGSTPVADWRVAVQKIERIIAEHPEQATMNNALRVREAMLLTVNQADALATEIWKQVDASSLGARDQSLYRLRGHLLWWYGRAGNPKPFSADEDRDSALPGAIAVGKECDNLTSMPDLRLFLATLKCNLELKRANSMKTTTDAEKKALAQQLSGSLKTYAQTFGREDSDWVVANFTKPHIPDGELLSSFRHRFALISEIKAYRDYAKDKTTVAWEPEWVAQLIKANP